MIAGPPRPDVPVPARVEAIAGARPLRAVWENELGGLTFEVGVGPDRCFVKWALLADVPPPDRLVVCHGDSCAPNTVLTDDGHFSGHVDLGRLGVADRWADLAIAAWSTEWNYGPGWDGLLLDAYGVSADRDRIRYYRLLWDLGP